ncbi:GTP cyclohydrolase I FolE2 [Desulforhopalus singaporensis]|uniref:GTP cyclohydrolase I n=1 Tax=Desulforhopalus singaporensis TaxID=91360 RepID=A0A1H0QN14_9BACT|nr:GTP cyclohydrolase, FolE2/MptA family [Desulforhopalus singaporensis]SDP18753.1 GTP cyclohydrolase I [Desulforhopalus singaporensis]
MKDIQSQFDSRRINIKKVGVKTVSYPITVRDKAQKKQHTIAKANMYVNLPHKFKGTHMSRFVEILNEFHGEIDIKSFAAILGKMKDRLDAEASHLELEFPYFLKKKNQSGAGRLGNYQCAMHGSLEKDDDLILSVDVPISLPISESKTRRLPGSMGSWGKVEVSVRFNQFFWIEDIIVLIENAIELELNKMLENAKATLSVETLAKTVGEHLEKVEAIKWFSLTVHNFGEECSMFATMESR